MTRVLVLNSPKMFGDLLMGVMSTEFHIEITYIVAGQSIAGGESELVGSNSLSIKEAS
jgi:hypothetical protein